MEQEIPLLMAVMLQVVSVAVLALGAALVAGWSSAASVMLGGGAAIVPNSLFAMRLALQRGRSAESYPVVFFLGQFAKIGLTVGLLAAIVKWLGSEVQWLPLLLGLIVALKAPLFALLYVRSQPGPAPAARVEGGSTGNDLPTASRSTMYGSSSGSQLSRTHELSRTQSLSRTQQ